MKRLLKIKLAIAKSYLMSDGVIKSRFEVFQKHLGSLFTSSCLYLLARCISQRVPNVFSYWPCSGKTNQWKPLLHVVFYLIIGTLYHLEKLSFKKKRQKLNHIVQHQICKQKNPRWIAKLKIIIILFYILSVPSFTLFLLSFSSFCLSSCSRTSHLIIHSTYSVCIS